jgi:HlyD family secretion protein
LNTPNQSANGQGLNLQDLIEEKPGSFLLRHRRLAIVAVAAVLVAAFLWLRSGRDAAAPTFKTEPATTGTLVVKVSATGKLQPTNQVDVGSELSGIVNHVFVDENDHVKQGQVLAQLDLAKLQDNVEKSRAALASAEAQVLQAQATVAEKRSTLARYQQVSELSGGKVPARNEMDSADASAKRAVADEASARALVAQARAGLRSDETNLYKASIRSPIDGIVLTRKVEPGQTVAASFQAPVMFTLAEDLKQMELQVDVDEADVGQVKVGQSATFTVDAWPGRKYSAVITRVGYGSQEKEGVVSYLSLLRVGNDDLSLRPGMTGTAEITTLIRKNALLVPNAALRFTPPKAEAPQKKQGTSVLGALMPRPPPAARKAHAQSSDGKPQVWILKGGKPVAVEVSTGATNGKVTEITGGGLKDGMEVITEAVSKSP